MKFVRSLKSLLFCIGRTLRALVSRRHRSVPTQIQKRLEGARLSPFFEAVSLSFMATYTHKTQHVQHLACDLSLWGVVTGSFVAYHFCVPWQSIDRSWKIDLLSFFWTLIWFYWVLTLRLKKYCLFLDELWQTKISYQPTATVDGYLYSQQETRSIQVGCLWYLAELSWKLMKTEGLDWSSQTSPRSTCRSKTLYLTPSPQAWKSRFRFETFFNAFRHVS